MFMSAAPDCGYPRDAAPPRLVDRLWGAHYGAPRSGRFSTGAGAAWLHVQMSEGRPSDPLARLGERIDRARSERARREPVVADRSALQQGLGSGFRIGIELVVAIAVATA